MCAHRFLDSPDGLLCDRTDPHSTGHTYTDTHGSSVPDHHDLGSEGQTS